MTMIIQCRGADSNRRHQDFQSCALPTELPRRKNSSKFQVESYKFNTLNFELATLHLELFRGGDDGI